MLDVLRFWLDRGVDGFRFDVAHNIVKHPELLDNPPAGESAQTHKDMGEYGTQLHVHDRNHPDLHEVYKDVRTLIDSYSTPGHERFMIGETHVFDPGEWAMLFGDGMDEMHLPGNFGLLLTPWKATAIRRHVDAIEAAVPPGGWPNYVISNHDDPRTATRVGPAQAKVAMMLLLTLRGTPTIYNGEELGMENVSIPAELEQDPFGKRVPGLGLGRDPQRTPMQWDTTVNAGFAPAGVTTWLPLEDDAAVRNVLVERAEPKSMLNLTHELLTLRREWPALAIGSYAAIDGLPEECFVYTREISRTTPPDRSQSHRRRTSIHAAVYGHRSSHYLDRQGPNRQDQPDLHGAPAERRHPDRHHRRQTRLIARWSIRARTGGTRSPGFCSPRPACTGPYFTPWALSYRPFARTSGFRPRWPTPMSARWRSA